MNGGAGRDTLNGGADNDTLNGGGGNDTLNGDAGDDTLNGGIGNDTLNGGDGADTLIGGLGADTLNGGAGNDTFKFNSLAELAYNSGGSPNYDSITGLQVGDKIDLSAIAGLSFVGIGKDFSGAGNEIRIQYGSLSIDTTGDKSYDYYLSLSSSNLMIEETSAGSRIFQVAADKTLTGDGLANTLTGGNGNDTLNGLGGNDTLIGGLGADTLTGGAGNDTFKYNSLTELSQNSSFERITDLAVGDKIDLSAIAGLSFVGIGNDFSGAGNEIRIQYGYLGIDTNGDKFSDYQLNLSNITNGSIIEETSGGSRIFQLAANQTLTGDGLANTLTGGNGNDTINGLGGNDILSGGNGNDTLYGGDGADRLTGGLGLDTLTGGAGNDIFKFLSSSDAPTNLYPYDTITDFATGDIIDLTGMDADTTLANDQAFSFVGANSFSGVAGELRYQYGSLSGDTNGDSQADFQIQLTGSPALAATDFFL